MKNTAAAQQAPQGIALAIAAVACLAALDTSSKYAAPVVPLAMAMWCRFAFQAGVTATAMLPTRGRALLRTRRSGLQLLRGVLIGHCADRRQRCRRHLAGRTRKARCPGAGRAAAGAVRRFVLR